MSTAYNLSSRTMKLIELAKTFRAFDGSVSPENVDSFNKNIDSNAELPRKLFGKKTKNVIKRTYIIPVDDGNITGYLFERKNRADSGLAPLIIFIHGGGWIWGSMDVYSYLCSRLAEKTNALVLSIDYRLAPRFKFPQGVEDCYSAFLWAAAGTRYWKVDPDNIYLMGDSAGGNLAAVVSRLARDRKGPPIAGQILLYPITDGRLRTKSLEMYGDSPTLTAKEVQFYVQQYQNEPKDILNPEFSPLLAKDHSRLPPTLIISAEYDPLKDDSILYADALASADTPVKYLEVKKSVHGFYSYPAFPGYEEATCAIAQFIEGRPIEKISLMTNREMREIDKSEVCTIAVIKS